MKKLVKILLTLAMFASITAVSPLQVQAEEPYTDTSYWNNFCADATNSRGTSCDAYREYLRSQSSDLSDQLNEIENKKAQYASDIAAYKDQIAQLQTDIDTLNSEISDVQAKIDDLQTQIDAKQVEIDNKQKEIDSTQSQIDTISEKLKKRMSSSQSSMKISKYIDILMGASSLSDFIRILSGLQAITDSDNASSQELVTLKDQLNTEKTDLQTAQDDLKTSQQEQQTQKDTLTSKQGEIIVKQADYQAAEDAAESASAQLEAEGSKISSNIDSIKSTLQSVAAQYGNVTVSEGWTYPVPGSYRSAGTWNYSGGGVHLGYDFAVSGGENVLAVGNGVVINSANGCPVGYLGSTCGSQYGGSTGGGNQVYLLTAINGNLYAVKYLHLLLNTPLSTGTVVSAGDVVGRVGSSGNSSGPHCHIEIFYLGSASDFSSYLANWGGDLAFGCGWAGDYDGYGRRCDAGYDAPCRLRPESVFGG